MPWNIKTNDDGKAVLNESGQPLFIGDDGKEAAFDDVQAEWGGRLAVVNKESADRRHTINEYKTKLETWESLGLDPEAAQAAIKKAEKIDLNKLKTADEVEAKIASVTESLTAENKQIKQHYEGQLSETSNAVAERDATIHKLVITNAFATSKLFTNNPEIILGPRLAEKEFGTCFRVEDGKAVCYPQGFDRDGKPIGEPFYSRKDPGKLAGFDESIEHLWSNWPEKDNYTRAKGGGDHTLGGDRSKGSPRGLEAQLAEAHEKGDFVRASALKRQLVDQRNAGAE